MEELLLMAREPVAAPPAVGANFTSRVTAKEGFRVSGKVAPETVKPVPLMVDELIVTAAVPVEVNVIGSVADEPSLTVPKLRLPVLSASVEVVAEVPVPLNGTVSVVCLAALLVMVSVPAAAFADVGANVTFRVAVCFGLIVIGRVPEATLNPVPLMAAALMVNVAVPVEVIVTGNVAFDPTATLPKLSLVKLISSWEIVVTAPVVLRLTVAVAFVEELLLMVNVPFARPNVSGEDLTSSVAVCFGLRVSGNFAPETVKPMPLIVAELTVTAAVPVEVSVTGSVVAPPTITLPKLRLVGLTESVAVAASAELPVEITKIRQQIKIKILLHRPLSRGFRSRLENGTSISRALLLCRGAFDVKNPTGPAGGGTLRSTTIHLCYKLSSGRQ